MQRKIGNNLISIFYETSVEEIDQSAFEDCRSLEIITFGGELSENKLRITNDKLQTTNKIFRNGQFYILCNGETYNASGVRVE